MGVVRQAIGSQLGYHPLQDKWKTTMNCYLRNFGGKWDWQTAGKPASGTPIREPDWETNVIATRGDKWRWRRPEEPDTTSQTGRQMNCYKGRHIELETAKEPDTTSQTGRHMNCYKGRQMNWRQPKSRTPPARPGDKWIPNKGRQMNWRQLKSRDTTSQTGRQMNLFMGRQMNWRQPESRTPQARLGNKWIVIWGDKWLGDSRRALRTLPARLGNK